MDLSTASNFTLVYFCYLQTPTWNSGHHQLEITDLSSSSKEEWFEKHSWKADYLLVKKSKLVSVNPTPLFVTWPRNSRSLHKWGICSHNYDFSLNVKHLRVGRYDGMRIIRKNKENKHPKGFVRVMMVVCWGVWLTQHSEPEVHPKSMTMDTQLKASVRGKKFLNYQQYNVKTSIKNLQIQ